MSFNVINQAFGLSFIPQSDLQTPQTAPNIWKIGKLNAPLATVRPVTESDAGEVGRGSEFASTTFPINMEVAGSFEKRLSSEIAAWAFMHGFGGSNLTVTPDGTGTKYVIHAADSCDEPDMPAFTVVEQLGCGANAGIDRALVGCVVNDFGIRFETKPGRNNTMISVNYVGSGKVIKPSAIVLPAEALSEHLLSGMSAAVNIGGINYSAAGKGLLSLDMRFENAIKLDQGFYIGSGVDAKGYALRGLMEHGTRRYTLSFTARMAVGTPEYDTLVNRTAGPATIVLTGAEYATGKSHKVSVTYNNLVFTDVQTADAGGTATVNVTCEAGDEATDGPVTVEVCTATAGIGVAA